MPGHHCVASFPFFNLKYLFIITKPENTSRVVKHKLKTFTIIYCNTTIRLIQNLSKKQTKSKKIYIYLHLRFPL